MRFGGSGESLTQRPGTLMDRFPNPSRQTTCYLPGPACLRVRTTPHYSDRAPRWSDGQVEYTFDHCLITKTPCVGSNQVLGFASLVLSQCFQPVQRPSNRGSRAPSIPTRTDTQRCRPSIASFDEVMTGGVLPNHQTCQVSVLVEVHYL